LIALVQLNTSMTPFRGVQMH